MELNKDLGDFDSLTKEMQGAKILIVVNIPVPVRRKIDLLHLLALEVLDQLAQLIDAVEHFAAIEF